VLNFFEKFFLGFKKLKIVQSAQASLFACDLKNKIIRTYKQQQNETKSGHFIVRNSICDCC
jgi:hypothetical protein